MARRSRSQVLARERERLALLDTRVKIEHTKAMLATYKAAQRDRATSDWRAPRKSANAAVVPDLPILHPRARQLVRDDAYAASLVRAFKRNVIGTGLSAFARRTLPDGSLDVAWNRRVNQLWRRWERDPRRVDVERRRNLMMFGHWAVSELVGTGEACIVKCLAQECGRPRLRLQAIESEQFADDLQEYEGNEVIGGVEVDRRGAAIAYHFRTESPGQLQPVREERVRITADRVAHVMDPDRAQQTRGVTRLAPVMLRLRHLGMFDSANLIAARGESNIGLVIESPEAEAPLNPAGTTQQEKDELPSEPFTIARLRPGQKAVPFIPHRAGANYSPFTEAQLRAIAAATGSSYEQIARDFTRGSYSSQRQSMLEDRREYAMMHELLVALMFGPIREWFIAECVLDGQLVAHDYSRNPDDWNETLWLPDGWQWIDPSKEASADATAWGNDFATHQEIVGRRSGELSEDVMRECARERARRRRLIVEAYRAEGLPPPPEDGAAPAPSTAIDHADARILKDLRDRFGDDLDSLLDLPLRQST